MLKLPRDRSQCSQRPALCGVFGCGAARLMSVMGRILLKNMVGMVYEPSGRKIDLSESLRIDDWQSAKGSTILCTKLKSGPEEFFNRIDPKL